MTIEVLIPTMLLTACLILLIVLLVRQNALKHEQEKAEQTDRQNVRHDIDHHARLDVAADTQVVIHREKDGREGAAERVGAQISYRRVEEVAVCPHQSRKGLGCEGHHASHQYRGDEYHQDRAGKNIVRRFLIVLTERDRDRHRCTDADEIGKRKIYHNEGHCDIHRRKRALSECLSDENALEDAVNRHCEHTYHTGHSDLEKEPPRVHQGIHLFGLGFHIKSSPP
jgi:hypothetical protein